MSFERLKNEIVGISKLLPRALLGYHYFDCKLEFRTELMSYFLVDIPSSLCIIYAKYHIKLFSSKLA